MASIQNFFTSRDNNTTANVYVGQLDRLWYDPVTNSIYVSDGVTPGGILVSGGSGNVSVVKIPAVYFEALTDGNNQSFSNVVLGSYSSNTDITLFYNGSLLENTYYTLSGSTLTINTPLVTGDTIDIIQQFANAQDISGYNNANVVSLLNTGLAGNIIPAANVTYTLGNATNQWASVYVGANTLYINSVPITVDGTTLQVAGANVVTSNSNISSNKIFNGTSSANIADADGNLVVAINANEWSFNTDGTTTFPNSSLDVGNAYLTIVSLQGVEQNYSNPAADNGNIAESQIITDDGGVNIYLDVQNTDSYRWTFAKTGFLNLPGTGTISAGDGASLNDEGAGYSQLYWNGNIGNSDPNAGGDYFSWVYASADGVEIKHRNDTDGLNSAWIFNTDGTLELPRNADGTSSFSSIITEGAFLNLDVQHSSLYDVYGGGRVGTNFADPFDIVTDFNDTQNTWRFNPDGTTVFPTLSVQRGDVVIGTITGQTLAFGNPTQEAIITTPDGNPEISINSQRLVINPGQGLDSGEGGDIYLWAGRGGNTNGSGGDVKIRGGFGPGDGTGGYIRIEGGASEYDGEPGFIEITGGYGGHVAGGPVTILGGYGFTTGGVTTLQGGYGETTGGNVNITGGLTSGGTDSQGNVNIGSGENIWTFDNSGNLTAPGSISAVGDITVTNLAVSNAVLGNLSLGTNYIVNLSDPIGPQDAATKSYVDSVAQGIHVHEQAYLGTTTDFATWLAIDPANVVYTQPNGTGNGVGATLTFTGNTLTALDGVTLVAAPDTTRLLVKNEGNAVTNGIYTYTDSSTLTRSTDADVDGDLNGGDYVFIMAGVTQAGSGWIETTANVIIGVSDIIFDQFSSSASYTANTAAGLVLVGSQFNAKVDDVTTAFDGTGNIVVKASAQLTTPNIDSATGTSLSVTGGVTAASVTGTITTNAQPNITSVGTLTSLNTGTISSSGNVTGANIRTVGSVSATGNITGSYLFGNVSQVTGTVPDATQAAFANNAGIVTTATQLNITRLGTLVNVSVTGNVTTSANVVATNNIIATGNIVGGNILTVGSVSATGSITGDLIIGNGSQLTGLAAQTKIIYSDSDVTINGSGGTITANVGGIRGLALNLDRFAVGIGAGLDQAISATAVGPYAGQQNQRSGSVAVGYFAADTSQGSDSIAIGRQAGRYNQGNAAIAIGTFAGNSSQGAYSIAIGTSAGAVSQPANSIVLMASSDSIPDPTNSGLYIKPVRSDSGNTAHPVYYNTTTNEVTYGGTTKVSYANVALNTTMSLDNLRFQLQNQNGGIWLFGATGTGNATWSLNAVYSEGSTGGGFAAGSISSNLSATTSFQTLITALGNISRANISYTWIIIDTTAGVMYRLTWQSTTGTTPYGSYITIEKL